VNYALIDNVLDKVTKNLTESKPKLEFLLYFTILPIRLKNPLHTVADNHSFCSDLKVLSREMDPAEIRLIQ
jgi:hypothetical protein